MICVCSSCWARALRADSSEQQMRIAAESSLVLILDRLLFS
jgi:hypothetical protein